MELEFHQLDRRYERLRSRNRAREAQLVASLAERGQLVPVIVVAGTQERFVLVDGYKRVRALDKLGRDTVEAMRWEIEEAQALIVERLLRTGAADSALEQGWLLRELAEHFHLDIAELAQRFDRTPSWVSRRLALVRELPGWIQERVRAGELVAHGAMRYLVPLARANRPACERLVAGLGQHKLTTRELGVLYAAYQAGDEPTREHLLADPFLFLRAHQEAERSDPPVRPPAERLLDAFDRAGTACRRAHARLDEGLIGRLTVAQRDELARCALEARHQADALWRRCDQELSHAGSVDAHGDPAAA